MARWAGTLTVTLNSTTHLNVFASLSLSSVSKNVLFFKGDQLDGTNNKIIEELSNSANIAELLVSKLLSENVFVVSAASFNGPFSVYKEFVPSVDSWGDPLGYHPAGLPASTAIVELLKECNRQVSSKLGRREEESINTPSSPKTVLIGFSKGGIVLNQILTEISSIEDASNDQISLHRMESPNPEISFLKSISEIHFVDVGLNCPGAYLTDACKIKKIIENLHGWNRTKPVKIVLHGTPRQWCDARRPWICEEKDKLVALLREEEVCSGVERVCFKEVMYFSNMSPSLQMHFEIIKSMQLD